MTRIRKFLPFFLIVSMAVAVYGGILGHDFLTNWDDTEYVSANPAVWGLSLQNIVTVFSSYYGGNYAPVQMLSYMLDYDVWGLKAYGFLLTNILLHTANSCIIYHILRKRFDYSEGISTVAALLFLCHPVQVESVAWISQRKNILSASFFLLSFLAYLRYAALPASSRKAAAYVTSLATYALALLTKSVTVVLPFILLLHDLCFDGQRNRLRTITDKLPYLVLSAASVVVTLLSQNPTYGGGIIATYHGESGLSTMYTMATVLPRYLRILFFPSHLSPYYDIPIKTSLADIQVILSLTLSLLLLLLGIRLYRRDRQQFFWYAFFFIALLPVSQIVPIVTLMNDRYLYFPLMGLTVFVTRSFEGVVRRCRTKSAGTAVRSTGVIALTCLAIAANLRTGVWRDSITLWEDAVKKFPNSSSAWTGLATSRHAYNEPSAAVQAYLRAVNLNPSNKIALNNLTLIYLSLGKQEKAEEYALHLVRTNPDYALGFVTLGSCYLNRGEDALAELADNRALSLSPGLSSAWNLKGDIALFRKQYDQAAYDYGKGYEADGTGGDFYHYAMAGIEAERGNAGLALAHLKKAFQEGLSTEKEAILNNGHLKKLAMDPEFIKIVEEGYQRNKNKPLIFK